MGGAPEGGGPPMAAIPRGPCLKALAEFDRRPLAGARRRLSHDITYSRNKHEA